MGKVTICNLAVSPGSLFSVCSRSFSSVTQTMLPFPLSLQLPFSLSMLGFGSHVNPLVQIPHTSPFGHRIARQEDTELYGGQRDLCAGDTDCGCSC